MTEVWRCYFRMQTNCFFQLGLIGHRELKIESFIDHDSCGKQGHSWGSLRYLIHPGVSTTAKNAGSGTPDLNLTSDSNTASPPNSNIAVIVGGAVGGAAVIVAALYLLRRKMLTMPKMPEVDDEPRPAYTLGILNQFWIGQKNYCINPSSLPCPPAHQCLWQFESGIIESALDVDRKTQPQIRAWMVQLCLRYTHMFNLPSSLPSSRVESHDLNLNT